MVGRTSPRTAVESARESLDGVRRAAAGWGERRSTDRCMTRPGGRVGGVGRCGPPHLEDTGSPFAYGPAGPLSLGYADCDRHVHSTCCRHGTHTMTTHTTHLTRDLDHRRSDGIDVRLLWCEQDGRVL